MKCLAFQHREGKKVYSDFPLSGKSCAWATFNFRTAIRINFHLKAEDLGLARTDEKLPFII